jgi:hypothetical protein
MLKGEGAVEVGTLFGHYAGEWARSGGKAWCLRHQWAKEHDLTPDGDVTVRDDLKDLPTEGIEAVFATISEDPEHHEVERVKRVLQQTGARILAVDHPRGKDISGFTGYLKKEGWDVEGDSVLSTALGDSTARKRWVLTGRKGKEGKTPGWWHYEVGRERAVGVEPMLTAPHDVPPWAWWAPEGEETSFQLDRSAGAKREPLMPRATGRVGRRLVYDPKHPAGPSASKGLTVAAPRGPDARILCFRFHLCVLVSIPFRRPCVRGSDLGLACCPGPMCCLGHVSATFV